MLKKFTRISITRKLTNLVNEIALSRQQNSKLVELIVIASEALLLPELLLNDCCSRFTIETQIQIHSYIAI